MNIKSENLKANAVIGIYGMSSREPLLLENIKNGQQTLKVKPKKPGYAGLSIGGEQNQDFWIYLSGDTYDVVLDGNALEKYPVRNSTSLQGKELIAYYQLKDELSRNTRDSVRLARKQLDEATPETIDLVTKEYNKWQDKAAQTEGRVITAFATKYPGSMLNLLLIEQAGTLTTQVGQYQTAFKKLGSSIRESKEGTKIARELNRVAKLQIGDKMATINGKDLAGSAFNPKIFKKLNLIICWTSYDESSRKNNVQLVERYEKYRSQGVEFIGVSFDKYEKWWKGVVKGDGLTWPQYADLLGAKSPNPGNLSNYKAPFMFLTDQSGKILSTDIQIENLDFEISNRLQQVK